MKNNPVNNDVIISYIDSVINNTNSFKLQIATYNEVLKSLKSLRNDSSTRYDNIPVSSINPVAKHSLSIDSHHQQLDERITISRRLKHRSYQPDTNSNPTELKDYQPISILPILLKFSEKIVL